MNFLELLRAGHGDYVLNGDAFSYMRKHALTGSVIARLEAHDTATADRGAFSAHLGELGIDQLDVHPDPVKIATERPHCGAASTPRSAERYRHRLRWRRTVPCRSAWFVLEFHAERLIHKLVGGFNDGQKTGLDLVRQLVWWFYADLKAYKQDPQRPRAAQLRARFDRIFKRKTGFATLDRLLTRLHARKPELLLVLDRPEIPLHTNGSENDIRCHVTKRKISGGTWSDAGRQARDTLLGCMKTCQKLNVSFFQFLGHRLAVPYATEIPPLAQLVTAANA
ncbi:MAG: transposase [Geminicoccaceae bacterium]